MMAECLCLLPNSGTRVLTLRVAVFGGEVSREVIKVKCDHKAGALIQLECYSHRRRY